MFADQQCARAKCVSYFSSTDSRQKYCSRTCCRRASTQAYRDRKRTLRPAKVVAHPGETPLARARRLRGEGRCASCGVPRGDSRSTWFCQTHLDKTKASKKAQRAARKAANVCVDCRERAIHGTSRCREHNRLNSLRSIACRERKEARACAA